MNYNPKLKKEIDSTGLTQKQFAEYANITPETLTRVLYNKHKPRVHTVLKICEALNTTPEAVNLSLDVEVM